MEPEQLLQSVGMKPRKRRSALEPGVVPSQLSAIYSVMDGTSHSEKLDLRILRQAEFESLLDEFASLPLAVFPFGVDSSGRQFVAVTRNTSWLGEAVLHVDLDDSSARVIAWSIADTFVEADRNPRRKSRHWLDDQFLPWPSGEDRTAALAGLSVAHMAAICEVSQRAFLLAAFFMSLRQPGDSDFVARVAMTRSEALSCRLIEDLARRREKVASEITDAFLKQSSENVDRALRYYLRRMVEVGTEVA
jgi:hypothetical protein